MALPRLDYQQPDYLGQIGQGVDAAMKVAHDLTPAHPLVQKYLKAHLNDGMDPREAAIMAKLEAAGHIGGGAASPTPGSPDMEPYPDSPPQPTSQLRGTMQSSMPPQMQGRMSSSSFGPQRLRGSVTDVTNGEPEAPGEAVGMRGSMRSSMDGSPPPAPQAPGGFTGRNEYTSEETVTGYPSALPSSKPMMSGPATQPRDDLSAIDAPILNKDVPVLMQAAAQEQKHDPMNTWIKLQQLGYRGAELQEKFREFEALQPGRDARTEATRANTANMPFRNSMQERNAQMRQRGLDISAARLGEQQTEQYMKNAGPSLEMSNALGQLLDEGRRIPGVQAPDEYSRARRAAEIYEKMPILGQSIAEYVRNKASEQLTPAQREWQRRLTQSMAEYIHGKYGANLTGHELRLAQTIAGDQFGYEDTLAALTALKQSVESHAGLAGQAWPGAAQRIGKPQLPALSPPQQLPQAGRQRLSAKQYGAQSTADVEMLRRSSPNVDWIDDVSDDVSNIGGQ